MMANGNSKRGITARSLPSRRTFRKLASATAGCVACRAELLERRMLLSGAPPSPDVLAGPVSSTDTAAWYHERVAVLQSLHLTEKAEPFDQIRRVGNAIPAQTATPQAPGLTPTQLKNYYDFTGLSFGSTPADGRGQTIALVDAFNDPDITGDLKTFDDAYGLAAPPSFKVVSQTGSTTALPGTDTPDPEFCASIDRY